MGARTLVAAERPDGRYDLHHSQWGGEHLDRLSVANRVDELSPHLVDPEPFHTAVPPDGVLAALDPREYEALVVLDGTTAAYLVFRLGVETARTSGRGQTSGTATGCAPVFVRDAAALVRWTDAATARRLRRFSRITKGVLGDAVDAGLLPAGAATAYFGIRLARHPDVPDEVLWLPPGGERPR